VTFGSYSANSARDPTAEWIFITEQLNTHQSESLVRWVAEVCELDLNLGVKGSPAFSSQCQQGQRFYKTRLIAFGFYTPKHTSWLNQIELWFSILVRRAGVILPQLQTSSSNFCPSSPISTKRWLNPSNGLTKVVHWLDKLTAHLSVVLY